VDGRKTYDLELVRDAGAGGLLLFKGTEAGSLVEAGGDGEAGGASGADAGAPTPWSVLGLSLTDTSRLLFRSCAAGEGLRASSTFAVLGSRHLPFGEWLHVACDVSHKSVVLYVNGAVDAEKPLDPSLQGRTAESAEADDAADSMTIDDFNPSPLFVGQPPSYATVEKGAEGLLQGLTVVRRSLAPEEIKALAAQRPPAETPAAAAATQDSSDARLLDAISLSGKCLRLLPPATVRSAITPAVVQTVLGLALGGGFSSASWGLQARVAATRLGTALLPFVDDVALANIQLAGVVSSSTPQPQTSSSLAGKGPTSDAAAGDRRALVTSILMAVGAFLMAPYLGEPATRGPAMEAAESRAALAHQRLALLRSLARVEAWSGSILAVMAQVLKGFPALLARFESSSGADGMQEEEEVALPLAAAVLALLGGYVEGLTVGADVLVEVHDRKGSFEEGTVLGLTHAAAFAPTTTPSSSPMKTKETPPRGLGEAVVVVLRSDPARPQVFPREHVTPQPCGEQAAFLRCLATKLGADVLLGAFRCVLLQDLRSTLPRYAPRVVEEVEIRVVESAHPHERGVDTQTVLRFPGAKSIEVTFDDQSRTAWGKTYVQFLKGEGSLEWYGKECYQGRDREQCWAGAHGAPPLIIFASSCVVRFVADANEEPDWGFKLLARAHTVREVPPPEQPPPRRYAARVQLCMQGTKALAALLQAAPALGRPAASGGLLRALVGSALSQEARDQVRGRYRRRSMPLELESRHPYTNNVEQYEAIAFPGARRLIVKFDPKSSSEKGCDFVRFYRDESRTAYW